MSRPGHFGKDEQGFDAIRGCVHKRRALNTRLSYGTSSGTFACPAGPCRNCRGEAGTKKKSNLYFGRVQNRVWNWILTFDPKISWISFSRAPGPPLRWVRVFLEQTRLLSGIQFTTHFIEFFVVETKRFVSSTVNVILTRQTCGQCWSRAAIGKRRALAFYFSIRIWCVFGASKCTGDSDLSVHTTLELAKKMRLHSGGDAGWAKKGGKKRFFSTKKSGTWPIASWPKKKPDRAGSPKRLGLVLATPRADFAVITAKLWWIMTAIFARLALSWIKCSFFRIIVNYCQLQKTPTNWMWAVTLRIWSFRTST